MPKIDKSALALGVPERVRDEKYREWVASQPCIACGLHGASQAAHMGYGNHGRSIKAGDDLVFAACHEGANGCHVRHDEGEGRAPAFWRAVLNERPDLLIRAVKAMLREEYREWNGSR